MNKNFYDKLNDWPAAAIGTAVLAGVAYYAFISFQTLEQDKEKILAELETSRTQNYSLIQLVREKEGTINSFQGQLGEIAGTLGTLEKLAATDEELLKKYSKVYFLNENYIPPALSDVDERYLSLGTKNFYIYGKVWPYLKALLEAGEKAGMNLRIASAYRSFDTQSSLKASYKVLYGSGANAFSADQGYSEHQLGTAVDFSTLKLGANFNSFAFEPEYQWLINNAHKYGFILSYPPNNAYYKFEPWHWRFVGVELASELYKEGKYFYNLDQREIDEYLVKLFD